MIIHSGLRHYFNQIEIVSKKTAVSPYCDGDDHHVRRSRHLSSAAGRIFGHHHTTITRWIERSGRHSERLHERLFHRALTIGHLQLDELVTKVKQDAGRIWVWTAVAAQSKLILAFHIGRRSSADAHQLLHQVWQRSAPDSLPIFTSDGLNLNCISNGG